MKHSLIVPACALVAALLAPATAVARQTPAPAATPASAFGHHHRRHGMHGAFRGITLSADQRSRMAALREAFRKAHPKGSPRDPAAMKQLRSDMLNVLTPDQRKQFEANLAQMRAHRHDRNPSGPFAPSTAATPAPAATPIG